MVNQNLLYFKGKICSIFTRGINRNFKDESPASFMEQNMIYFVGVIDEIDDKGIMVSQVLTGLKTYFFLNSVVSISEEEMLNPSDEKDAATIEEIKTKNEELRAITNKKEVEETIDPDEMANILKNIKR